MKKQSLLFLIWLLVSGCSSLNSTFIPAKQALNLPTPEIQSLPLCNINDLTVSSSFTKKVDSSILGATFSNKTKNICTLKNPPTFQVLDKKGNPVDLQVTYSNEVNPEPAKLIQLLPAEFQISSINWKNYCSKDSNQPLTLRLILSTGQNLDIPISKQSIPECKAKDQPSVFTISQFSGPP